MPGCGGHADAGAIDQDVERAEGLQHLLDGPPALRSLGDISDGTQKLSGQDPFGSEAIETDRIDVDARNLGAGTGERAPSRVPCRLRLRSRWPRGP